MVRQKRSTYQIAFTCIIAVFVLLGTYKLSAQDKRFSLSLRTELADKNTHNDEYDYGFNIGVQIEYQMTIIYLNAETYWFPGLNGLDYLHFQGTVLGFNHHSWNEKWRIYLGVLKPGFILRGGGPHALFGHDLGVEHYFNDKYYIGIETGINNKGDSKLWSNDSVHRVWYASISFGITL
jgi:hypothetical protein